MCLFSSHCFSEISLVPGRSPIGGQRRAAALSLKLPNGILPRSREDCFKQYHSMCTKACICTCCAGHEETSGRVCLQASHVLCVFSYLCLIEIRVCLQAGIYLHAKDRAAHLASVKTQVSDNGDTAVGATPASEPLPSGKGPTGHPAGNPKTRKVSCIIWVLQFCP